MVVCKDKAEPARILTHEALARGQYQLFVQEVAMEKQLFLKRAWVQVLSQVDPDKEAGATIEKRDIQCLQLVSDVLVSRAQPEVINGQVRAVKPFWTRGGRGLSQIAELRSARGFLTKCVLPADSVHTRLYCI